MPRRREVPKRQVLPDPKHHSELLTKFINVVMVSGKKSIAEKIVYGALDTVRERTRKDPMTVFEAALENVAPRKTHFLAYKPIEDREQDDFGDANRHSRRVDMPPIGPGLGKFTPVLEIEIGRAHV